MCLESFLVCYLAMMCKHILQLESRQNRSRLKEICLERILKPSHMSLPSPPRFCELKSSYGS